jgi:serine/threonine protein kinase
VDSQPEPGIEIAGYRIEARIGRGGMGEVYRAVQLSLGRRVALKVLAPELAADDAFRRRFLRESRIAAGIDHPNIIPIYEAGEDGGLLYITMRYVEGSDLARLLEREGRLEPGRAMAVMGQVAGALDAAHARGLVHRDVKPANILLAEPAAGGGHCYLCDFGLIKQVGAEQMFSALTATDQFVGTIPYVAPEQIEGRDVDGRTDVYSLGCVLFQCLTGAVPFDGATDVEVVFAHLREPPPRVSAAVPSLPTGVDAVIARALAKAKEDRYPTCSALVAALNERLPTVTQRPPVPADDATRSMVLPPAPVPAPSAAAPSATDPTALIPSVAGPGAPRPGAPPPPAPPPPAAPPLARPARTPVEARSASGPPGGGAPGRRRGRRWATALAAIVLPVAAYLAAVELFGGGRGPEIGASPDQAGVAASPTTARRSGAARPSCQGGWTRPAVGTPERTAPLAAIRAQMGWTDRFVVEELRRFSGPGGLKRWYVKGHQETAPSRRGRWLVQEDQDGQRRVLATAAFDTRGYEARDWRVPDGQGELPGGVAGCLAGT